MALRGHLLIRGGAKGEWRKCGATLVRPDAAQSLWQAYLAGDRTTSWSRPWALVALNSWIEQNGLAA